jgi:hypothetical protein
LLVENSEVHTGFLQPIYRKIRKTWKQPFVKELRIFFVFLAIACFFWLLQSLQEERECAIQVPLTFTQSNPSVSVTNVLPSAVTVTVRDKGVNLYAYVRHRKSLTIPINIMDYYRKDAVGGISAGALESMIRKKLLPSTQLLRVNPEHLSFYFARKKALEVPVELVSDITLAAQRMYSDTPFVYPSHIRVFAPAGILKRLHRVQTEVLRLENVGDTTEAVVRLKPIQGVRFSTRTVRVRLCVEEFTERSLSVPVVGVDFPKGARVLTFPSTVTVTFFVGLSAYRSVDASDFKVGVRYGEMLHSSKNQCDVRLLEQPSAVQNVRIQPGQVECLLEKIK